MLPVHVQNTCTLHVAEQNTTEAISSAIHTPPAPSGGGHWERQSCLLSTLPLPHQEGGIGVRGIAELLSFLCAISVNKILHCSTAVISNSLYSAHSVCAFKPILLWKCFFSIFSFFCHVAISSPPINICTVFKFSRWQPQHFRYWMRNDLSGLFL